VSRDYSGGQGKSEASHSWEALMYQRWGQECGTTSLSFELLYSQESHQLLFTSFLSNSVFSMFSIFVYLALKLY
jgi:hypothetical protein